MQEIQVQSLGREVPQKGTATHSSILAWRIPMDRGAWRASNHRVTRVRHNWVTNIHIRSQRMYTAVLYTELRCVSETCFFLLASCLLDLFMMIQLISSSLIHCSITWVCPSSSDEYLGCFLCYSSPVLTLWVATGDASTDGAPKDCLALSANFNLSVRLITIRMHLCISYIA